MTATKKKRISKKQEPEWIFDDHEGLYFRPEFIAELREALKQPMIPIDDIDEFLGLTKKKKRERDLTEREIRRLEDRIDLRDHERIVRRLNANPEEFIQ